MVPLFDSVEAGYGPVTCFVPGDDCRSSTCHFEVEDFKKQVVTLHCPFNHHWRYVPRWSAHQGGFPWGDSGPRPRRSMPPRKMIEK